jgi:hypothetical protein
MNFRPAPQKIILAVKRRLAAGAQLVEDSVKLCAIPGTPFDATLFIFVSPVAAGVSPARVFVAELGADRGETPHIYNSKVLPPNDDSKEIAKIMFESILGLAQTIRTDSRFQPSIITLNSPRINGFAKVR